MEGLMYIIAFLAGAILSLSISSYYNNRIMELMREMMGRKRKLSDREGEANEGK